MRPGTARRWRLSDVSRDASLPRLWSANLRQLRLNGPDEPWRVDKEVDSLAHNQDGQQEAPEVLESAGQGAPGFSHPRKHLRPGERPDHDPRSVGNAQSLRQIAVHGSACDQLLGRRYPVAIRSSGPHDLLRKSHLGVEVKIEGALRDTCS